MQLSAEKQLSFFTLDKICKIAFISPSGTDAPEVSSIISELPPVSKVITGVPHARASMLTVGKLSSRVGFTNTSAAE